MPRSGSAARPEEELLIIFAYLDPGSGALILQALLGGMAGVAVAARAWKARLRGRSAASKEPQAESSTDESALTSET